MLGLQGFDISRYIDTISVDMTTLELIACCQPLDAPTLSENEAEATAALFKALADPARVRIVNLLATSEAPVCACEFMPALSLAQATVSHHLKKLTDAGLLDREQRGKWAYFSLNPEARARLAGLVDFPEVVR
jgi:ArsR family transcriptional regulator